jgi:hypothetical protein
MPFSVCQRSMDMVAACDADQAAVAAKSLFERDEHVPNWLLHADSVVTEALPVPALVHGVRRRTQEVRREADTEREVLAASAPKARAGRKVVASHKGRPRS